MFDLKSLRSVIDQLEQEKNIPREKALVAVETALAAAYKKEFGKKGQIVRASFDLDSGATIFSQVKVVVDETLVRIPKEDEEGEEAGQEEERDPEDTRTRFNPEHHILIDDARKIKKDVDLDEELIFPLENKADFGRIAAQTAKQVIIQKIREAEKEVTLEEFGRREGDIVSGIVQRVERGNIFIDLGKATGILPFEEQTPRERYKIGERLRAYLFRVEETPRGIHLRLSRTHPKFIEELFRIEAPEVQSGVVEIKGIAREPGSRSKIAVDSKDEHIDPVGSCVGQRGVRVSTVMSELSGEKIDIIEWSEEPEKFIADALSPAKIISVELNADEKNALVMVDDDELSLAIGKGGQNVRLAAKLTGWKIDIQSAKEDGEEDAEEKDEREEGKKETGDEA